jgi:hypothetical protein
MVDFTLTKGLSLQLLGYVLRPRLVLHVSDGYGSEDYNVLAKNVGAKWLLSRLGSPILYRMEPGMLRKVRTLPPPFNELALFSLEIRPTTSFSVMH